MYGGVSFPILKKLGLRGWVGTRHPIEAVAILTAVAVIAAVTLHKPAAPPK